MITKTEQIKKVGIICLLSLIPSLAHAELNISKTDAVLLGAIFFIPIISAVIGLISAFIYLKRGTKRAFYFSIIPAAILVVISYGFRTSQLRSFFGETLVTFISLSAPIILTLVSYKKIKSNPPQVFWFYVINTTSIMLFSALKLRFLFPILDITKPQDFVFTLNTIFAVLDVLICALYSFIYVRKTLQNNQTIENKELFFKVGLISVLSILTLNFLSILSIMQAGFETDFVAALFNIGLLIVMAISVLSTFVALKKYRR